MMSLSVILAAVLATAPAAPQAEIRNVRIASPKIQVSRVHADSESFVSGSIRVDMSFARKTARKPVLRLTCLCEADGGLVVHTVFLDRPRTYDGMRKSEIQTAFKNAGVDIPYKDRESMLSDPAKFTPYLSEVAKDAYASAVYGTADLKRGFFRLGRSGAVSKVLLYRIELWQNGVRTATYESSRIGLASYEIPDDWYQWKRYPQKFKYADIR